MNHCKRCGTCCLTSTPALHKSDITLAHEKISREVLITLRKGEPVQDNVAGKTTVLEQEIVKIKWRDGENSCILYDKDVGGCSNYNFRPEECKVLECWNPDQLQAMYKHNRITRADLIDPQSGLASIISDHELRCSVDQFSAFVSSFIQTQDEQILSKVAAMIDYDRNVRKTMTEKADAGPLLLFLFGRPLDTIMPLLGLELQETRGKKVFRKG